MLDLQQSVGSLVLDHPECAAVLQRHRVDYCCKGEQPLEAALAKVGAEAAALLQALEQAVARRWGQDAGDPRALSTPALIAQIISRFHGPLREMLPFVQALATKVARVHGEHNPKLVEVEGVVRALSEALLPHLDLEEQELFPALMAGPAIPAEAARGLATMQEEHLEVAGLLERLHTSTEDFAIPAWACTSYKTLFAELQRVETDLLAHIHLENHVLWPRFVAA
jgi:regulator of cell morphogenesis and NO signaling